MNIARRLAASLLLVTSLAVVGCQNTGGNSSSGDNQPAITPAQPSQVPTTQPAKM